ncbi:tetratricopeptide repeat protein, partial [Baaleninema sp.]|uniref:O-linked N-acetylglucosamine transferase, SPINDLY family protein n=1 Tax=Baaleninema sp. TaxID=3101197 RepID=UPI003D00D808
MDLDRFTTQLQQTPSDAASLVATAVSCLEEGELYCEIGILNGDTLHTALSQHPSVQVCAVETTTGSETDRRLAAISQILEAQQLDDRIFLLQQDLEVFFDDWTQLEAEETIGVYYDSGDSDYRSTLISLLRVKAFCSDRATFIIAHPQRPAIRQAVWDFLATHPETHCLGEVSSVAWVLAWNPQHPQPLEAETYLQYYQSEIIEAFKPSPKEDKTYDDAIRHHQAGNLDDAELLYRRVLQNHPHRVEAWLNLGMLYVSLDRPGDAITAFQSAIDRDRTLAHAYYGLGLAWERLNHRDRALDAYQQAIDRDSTLLDAYNNQGNLLLRNGQFDRAETLYRQALSLNPQHLGSWLNLGNALVTQRRLDDAIALYDQALQTLGHHSQLRQARHRLQQYRDDPTPLYRSLAQTFLQQGDCAAAIPLYRHLSQNGDATDSLALALCFQKTQQFDKAIDTLRQGVSRFPQNLPLQLKLISQLRDNGDINAALDAANSALAAIPHRLELQTLDRLLLPLFYHSPTEIDRFRQRFREGLTDILQNTPLDTPEHRHRALKSISKASIFYLTYQGCNDLELLTPYGDWVHRIITANLPQIPVSEATPPRQKLRIGYVGVSMGDTRLGELYLGWLKHANRHRFQIHTYYLGQNFTPLTQTFQHHSQVFRRLSPNLENAASEILRDRLDILIFPDIGLSSIVTQLAALRLAPVQCTTWAHPVTSGLPTVDYFLSSHLMEPANGDTHYREQLVRLPKIGMSVAKPPIPKSLSGNRGKFGLGVDRTLYLSCQSLSKYLPQYDFIFPQIAQAVPNAQFVFISHPNPQITQKFRHRLNTAFSQAELDGETFCTIVPRLAEKDYLDLNLAADIFLDTFSWSGGVTTLKAIACGLPVVTCPGDLMRSRHSFAILTTLGISETVASNPEEYIEIAVRLGRDITWRENLVEKASSQENNLFEDTDCVRALESFFESV